MLKETDNQSQQHTRKKGNENPGRSFFLNHGQQVNRS
jgi:hypothetical protein